MHNEFSRIKQTCYKDLKKKFTLGSVVDPNPVLFYPLDQGSEIIFVLIHNTDMYHVEKKPYWT
jgi:hypothetical protein